MYAWLSFVCPQSLSSVLSLQSVSWWHCPLCALWITSFSLNMLMLTVMCNEVKTHRQRLTVHVSSSNPLMLWCGLVQEVSVWSYVKQQPNVSLRIKQLLRPKTWSSCEWPSSCLCVSDCCVGGPVVCRLVHVYINVSLCVLVLISCCTESDFLHWASLFILEKALGPNLPLLLCYSAQF